MAIDELLPAITSSGQFTTAGVAPLGWPTAPNPEDDARQRTALRYHFDTIVGVAMTLRLTEEEQAALRERAAAEGISMQEAARRAVRDYIAQSRHRQRVATAATRMVDAHGDALRRLGE